MTEGTHGRTKQLFLDALALCGAEREAFLASECGGDAELRSRIDGLIQAYERSEQIETLAAPTPESAPPPLALVGDYELLEELGRGATGIVYRARQTSLGREVAIKILRAGSLASENDVRRFRREAEAAAALDHPAIVPVFDIGSIDGHNFFSMKLVDGTSLDRVIGRYTGDPRAAARLVATVARAVHHAHRRGVLHRDLKPSNILLSADGAPHVADFGIAQPLGQARITQTGHICGTPAYMSPEQARGGEDVTVATDVWSLGCVLHELLAGSPPFGGEGVAEVLRRVQEDPAPRLPAVDRDLTTVIEACLAKEPGRRYPTALALAEDLQRWLDHLPISARPTTRLERLRLLCRRSPVATFLGAAVVLLLLVVGIGAFSTSLALGRRLQETQEAEARANQRLRTALVANARAERRSDTAGRRAKGLEFLRQAAAIEPGPDLRDDAITTLTLPDLVYGPRWEPGRGLPVAVDDEFACLVLSRPDGSLELRGVDTGELRLAIAGTGNRAHDALFTGPRRLWVSRQPAPDSPARLEVWELPEPGAPAAAMIHSRPVTHGTLSRSHDGRTVALARRDGTVELMDSATFEVRMARSVGSQSGRCAFGPDGSVLAVPTVTGNTIEVLRIPDGTTLHTLQLKGTVHAIAWSPDGATLLAGCYDQKAYVWNTGDWTPRPTLHGHGGEVVAAAVLSGNLAVTHAWDRTTRIWDLQVGTELLRCDSFLLAAQPGGRKMLMGSDDTLGVAELAIGEFLTILHAHRGKAPREVAESPDGRFLASCGEEGWSLWDAKTCRRLAAVTTEDVYSVNFTPGGDAVLSSGDGGLLRWPLTFPAADGSAGVPDPVVGTPVLVLEGVCDRSAVSPDGRLYAVVRHPHALLVGTDGSHLDLGKHGGLDRVAFSPDGRWVVVGSWAGKGLRVWATATGELVTHMLPDESSAMGTFSPDSSLLVIATFDRVEVFRAGTWTLERRFERIPPRYPSLPAAFSPGGGILAMGIAPARVRLVATDDWRTLADLQPTPAHNLFHMRFVAGGRRLAIAAPDHRLLIWELAAIWKELAQRSLIDSSELPLRTTR